APVRGYKRRCAMPAGARCQLMRNAEGADDRYTFDVRYPTFNIPHFALCISWARFLLSSLPTPNGSRHGRGSTLTPTYRPGWSVTFVHGLIGTSSSSSRKTSCDGRRT